MAQSQNKQPDPNVLRVTSLIAPPAIRTYQLSSWDRIVVDVDDFLLAGFGTAWHQYLQRFTPDGGAWYSEQILQMVCDDMIISGTPDLRSTEGDIDDFKVTSAWSFVFAKPAWEEQLNTYALLAEANGFPIHRLTIHAFLRDWSARNAAQYKPDYPDRPFYSVNVPLWTLERRKAFVQSRLADHKNGVRPCTPEERWQRPTTWAVIKDGNKKAARVLDTQQDAAAWMSSKQGYHIECRRGSCRRCEDYCVVRSVCEFREG